MKLSAFIVAVTLGAVSAAPISLIYITNTGRTIVRTSSNPTDADTFQPLPHIRLGHAAAFANPTTTTSTKITTTGCHGLRAKMDRVREMLGLAPIIKDDEGAFHILPIPHRHEEQMMGKVTMVRWKTGPAPEFKMREATVWDRLHRSLNELGPWEGRAVTFVLGCGMGVILRMFFVLGILLVRARRIATRQPIELPVEPHVIFVAPPQYLVEDRPLVDEKAPIYEEIESPAVVDLDAKKDADAA